MKTYIVKWLTSLSFILIISACGTMKYKNLLRVEVNPDPISINNSASNATPDTVRTLINMILEVNNNTILKTIETRCISKIEPVAILNHKPCPVIPTQRKPARFILAKYDLNPLKKTNISISQTVKSQMFNVGLIALIVVATVMILAGMLFGVSGVFVALMLCFPFFIMTLFISKKKNEVFETSRGGYTNAYTNKNPHVEKKKRKKNLSVWFYILGIIGLVCIFFPAVLLLILVSIIVISVFSLAIALGIFFYKHLLSCE